MTTGSEQLGTLRKHLVLLKRGKVTEPEPFRLWRETMAAELTGTQDQLLGGPAWSGCAKKDIGHPLRGRFNIAAVSTRTTNKRLALATGFSLKPEIQEAAIDALIKLSVKRVWLKLDATDIKVSLQESQQGEWNGDVNLTDGSLENLQKKYNSRQTAAGLITSPNHMVQLAAIQEVQGSVDADIPFLTDGLNSAILAFQKYMSVANTPAVRLTVAAWEVADFNQLHQQAVAFSQQLSHLMDASLGRRPLQHEQLFPLYKQYLRNLFKRKRSAASHVIVILVSDEQRKTKPYSVPVRYIPYSSIRDKQIRDLTAEVKSKLHDAGIIVVGTVTDGEFCSLRSLGGTRPLHVWQVVKDVRFTVSKKSAVVLEAMLFAVGVDQAGVPVVRQPQPAIPGHLLGQILTMATVGGLSHHDIIMQIRTSLVPPGFQQHTWRLNTPESHLDRLRTVVATYMFRRVIADWEISGVDFRRHLYVPETDEITGHVHHERADHGHLLKRIAAHTRELRYQALTQEPFVQAMLDCTTGLTHAALHGIRKQSVVDAERLLSHSVAAFMQSHNYPVAAEYVATIAKWHEASDGRGLTEGRRSQYNQQMLDYLVKDWMPWGDLADRDYSLIDINRRMDQIRGFSRETFVEISTNIESQEVRWSMNSDLGPEHPRASTADDNECFFSICHRYLGSVFTLHDFKHRWQKIVNEFCKKMDPDLPFYYKTANERYREEEDDFNTVSDGTARLHRVTINRREGSSFFAANRTYLPQRHAQSIRQKFHAVASQADLPPVPQHLLPATCQHP